MSKRPLYLSVNHNLGANQAHHATEYTQAARADALDRLSAVRAAQEYQRFNVIAALLLIVGSILILCLA